MVKISFIKFIKMTAASGIALCMVLMSGCGNNSGDFGNLGNTAKDGEDLPTGNAVIETKSGEDAGDVNGGSNANSGSSTNGSSYAGNLAAQTQQQKQTEPTQNRTMGVCGIYIYNEEKGCREFIENVYESKWESGKDIICFEVINTHEETIPGKVFKHLWEPIWYATEEAFRYRIGYCVDFVINDKQSGQQTKVHKMIMEPDDTLEYKEYMEFYLYDDYHQTPGVWYSHVEQNQYDEDTLLTSIKFTAGKNVAAIDGDVKLTAFIYDPAAGQFDAAGDFTGSSKQTIIVKNIRQ